MSENLLTQQNESFFIVPQKEDQQQNQRVQDEKTQKSHPRIQDLIGLVTHQIQNEIQQSHINIPQKTKKFQINDKNNTNFFNKDAQKMDEKKISQIVKKKKDLEQQLFRLKHEQQQHKTKSRDKSPSQTQYQKTFKSKFTAQQQIQISQIIKKSEQFEQRIQSKQKQIKSKIQELKIKQKQQRQLYLRQLKQRKRQQSLKKIIKIQQQQKSRVQNIRKQNRRYQQVKRSKALHEKIQDNQKVIQELKRLKQQQLLRSKRRSMTLDAKELKQHEKKYYQTTRIIKQKIGHQFTQRVHKMRENQHLQAQTYKPSKFLVTLMNEQKMKQLQQRQRIEKMKSLFSKKNSFQEKLRVIHKQQIKTKPKKQSSRSIIQIKVEDRKLKAKSMSAADIYKQGQEFMRSAHSSINNLLVQKSKVQLQQIYKQSHEGSKTQYKNYLLESRLQKQRQNKSSLTGISYKAKQNKYELNRLQAIIKSKSQHESDKLFQAKIIVQKLQNKAKNNSTNALVDSIAAKLKIIEEFS